MTDSRDDSTSETRREAASRWDEDTRPRLRLDQVVTLGAARHPGRVAVVDGSSRRTYAELEADVDALVEGLRSVGVTETSRVAVSVPTGLAAATAIYAISRIGAVAVPLNELWSWHETLDVLERSGVDCVISDTQRAAPEAALLQSLDRMPHRARPILGVLSTPTSVQWLDGGRRPSARIDPTAQAEPDDVALLLFTSGSTSAPKGAFLTHAGLVGSASYLALACELGPEDRMIQTLPAYHVSGLVDGILLIHIVGGTCLPLRFDPERVLELFEEEGATFFSAFDSMIDSVLSAPKYSPGRHKHWRVALTTSKGADYDRLKQLGVNRIITGFGMTETCSNYATTRMTQPEAQRRNSEWLAYPGVEVIVVDPSSGLRLLEGEVGELRVRGWNVMPGYLDGSTGRDPEGFFRTGDLGQLHSNGTFTFCGRIKGMIKTGGENVVAHEVETALVREITEIRAATVVGIPDARWGEMVVAFVEFEPGRSLTPDEVRLRCRGRMASFKIPKRFIQVAAGEWPLMAAGKVDRPALVSTAVRQIGPD